MFFIRLRTDMICLTTLQPYALDTSATNTTPKNNSVFFFPPPMNIPIFVSPKTNIRTKNDGLEHVSPASHMASFWVAATFHFRASKSLVAHFRGDFSPRGRCRTRLKVQTFVNGVQMQVDLRWWDKFYELII